MKIAIVILNWNGQQLLEQFVPTMLAYSKNEQANIYVADNASTDDSVAYVQRHFPQVRIIQNTENGGFAKGYNDALRDLEEDLFCLVNSDIEVTPNWLDSILTTFSTNAQVAIIQPKILDYKNKTLFEYAGAAGGFIDKYGYPYCRGRIFNELEKDEGQFKSEELFWASGACFFVRREVYENLDGFDEDFFAHQEEIDFCWRALNSGAKIVYDPNSTVYHVGGATLSNQNAKKTYLNFRNSLFTLLKNLPSERLFPIIFMRLILDGIAGVKFLTEFKFKHIFAIIHAHYSFYSNFSKMYRKRGTGIKSANYYKTTSIVYSHFIQKKKFYNEL